MVVGGVPRRLEQYGRILLVLAVDHQCVKVFIRKPFYCSEGFGGVLHGKIKFTKDLRHRASTFLIGAVKQGLEAHDRMVGTSDMEQQVTDVIGLTRGLGSSRARIPLWVKVAWSVFVLVWAPLYWRQYGPQNFLFYCDLGNLLILAGLWLESRLIISWQAVGLLVFQTLYAVDLLAALVLHRHVFGGTEYMFDPAIPLFTRILGLYHVVVPVLLLWAVRRLGFDWSAWKWQTVLLLIVVPINFFWRPEDNVNFARGIGHEQHMIPAWLYLIGYLIVVPIVIYWPTHLFLRWWNARSANRVR